MVGETSLAATVVREAYPDHVILIPNTASALVDLDTADITPPNQMVWLDDLKQFLGKSMKDSSLVEYLEMAKIVETVTEVDDKFRGIIRPAVFPRLPEAEWWNLGVDGRGGLSDQMSVDRLFHGELGALCAADYAWIGATGSGCHLGP
jgi:hypothetical protein